MAVARDNTRILVGSRLGLAAEPDSILQITAAVSTLPMQPDKVALFGWFHGAKHCLQAAMVMAEDGRPPLCVVAIGYQGACV